MIDLTDLYCENILNNRHKKNIKKIFDCGRGEKYRMRSDRSGETERQRQRWRERDRDRDEERETETERDGECVCYRERN